MEYHSAIKRNEVHMLPFPFIAPLRKQYKLLQLPLPLHCPPTIWCWETPTSNCHAYQHRPPAWNIILTLQRLRQPQSQNARGLQATTGHSSGLVACREGYAWIGMRSLCSCHWSQVWLHRSTSTPPGSTTGPAPFWASSHQKICPSCPFSRDAEPQQGQSYPVHPSVMSI